MSTTAIVGDAESSVFNATLSWWASKTNVSYVDSFKKNSLPLSRPSTMMSVRDGLHLSMVGFACHEPAGATATSYRRFVCKFMILNNPMHRYY